MKQLGDITKIDGSSIPLVDVVVGGSPCQDLSTAGKRVGLGGERSGLFMEQLRVIKEMRAEAKRQGRIGYAIRPRFMLWENVPGAFSSNKGADFRVVLEETARVIDKSIVIPMPYKNKWTLSGAICGDNWSVAWRTMDAQYWGVPQRRRRIALVADFAGTMAADILFARQDIARGNGVGIAEIKCCIPINTMLVTRRSEMGRRMGLGIGQDGGVQFTLTATHAHAVYCSDRKAESGMNQQIYADTDGDCVEMQGTIPMVAAFCQGASPCANSIGYQEEVSPTLKGAASGTAQVPAVIALDQQGGKGAEVRDARITAEEMHIPQPTILDMTHANDVIRDCGAICPTLQGRMGTGGNQVPLTFQNTGRGWWNQSEIGGTIRTPCGGDSTKANLVYSMPYEGCQNGVHDPRKTVRRVTPTECSRLQGYPDSWCDIGDWVDENGKKHASSDSTKYKALGNSLALPQWYFVLSSIAQQLPKGATLGSLFDGIGGFPLIWSQLNGAESCKWASEIEPFPIAVSKYHFGESDAECRNAECRN